MATIVPSAPTSAASERVDRVARAALAAIVAAGAAFRLQIYLDRRSLWLDEVWLSLNIARRSFIELVGPLDFRQAAPIGFLWTEHAAVSLFGVNEFVLRACPLLAGLGVLWALWRIACRWLGPRPALVAVGLAAVSPALIRYSNEVKPYMVDALFTVVIVTLAFNVLEEPGSSRCWRSLIAGGAIAVIASTSGILVLAGAGLALVSCRHVVASPVGRRRLAIAGLTWAIPFAVIYIVKYRAVATEDFTQFAFGFGFPPPRFPGALRFIYAAIGDVWIGSILGNPTYLPHGTFAIVAALSTAGVVWLLRRYGVSVAALLVGPFIATCAAALLHRWPLMARLLVFLVPLLILMFTAGLNAAAEWLPPRARGLTLLAAGVLLFVPPAAHDVAAAKAPERLDHVAPLIDHFQRSHGRSALVYVFSHHAAASWLMYTTDWRAPRDAAFEYAWRRAAAMVSDGSRGCTDIQPGLRTVFGEPLQTTDPSVWAQEEARWLAAQPDEEIWLFFLGYDRRYLSLLRESMTRAGAIEVDAFSPVDPALYLYRFPPGARSSSPADCQRP